MTATYRESVQGLLRERLLDAAQRVVEDSGWSAVTMSGIAGAVGVSRQTVHNELGTRHDVAQALAMRELGRFLDVVRERMAAADGLVEGIRSACEGVLELGRESVLIRTIVGSVPSENDADFLKILTTESGEIVDTAGVVVRQALLDNFPDVPFADDELDVAVESIVRLVLSHVTRPSKDPSRAAADVAWIIELSLAGHAARS
ncbi:MAG: TetR family transcriptional regulator [Aeromicrobium erythreum]